MPRIHELKTITYENKEDVYLQKKRWMLLLRLVLKQGFERIQLR